MQTVISVISEPHCSLPANRAQCLLRVSSLCKQLRNEQGITTRESKFQCHSTSTSLERQARDVICHGTHLRLYHPLPMGWLALEAFRKSTFSLQVLHCHHCPVYTRLQPLCAVIQAASASTPLLRNQFSHIITGFVGSRREAENSLLICCLKDGH